MVKIRLARYGKKKKPTYRIVVSDSRKDTKGAYIENLGTYNPALDPRELTINAERATYWLSVGAQASPTVHNLFVDEGIVKESKIKASKNKPKKTEAETAAAETSSDEATEKNEESGEATTKEKPAETTESKTEEKDEEKPAEKKAE